MAVAGYHVAMNQPVSHSAPVSIDAAALAADPFALAQQLILEPAGLDETAIVQALAAATGPGIDAADLYFQFARDESWSLEDGIVKEGSANIEQGVGVRALSGEKSGFAYSDELLPAALGEAARAARAIARAGQSGRQPV